jgi:hypothetical protein
MQCPQIFCCFMFIFLVSVQSFVTGDEWSQRDQRKTGMGTSNVSNGIADLF